MLISFVTPTQIKTEQELKNNMIKYDIINFTFQNIEFRMFAAQFITFIQAAKFLNLWLDLSVNNYINIESPVSINNEDDFKRIFSFIKTGGCVSSLLIG